MRLRRLIAGMSVAFFAATTGVGGAVAGTDSGTGESTETGYAATAVHTTGHVSKSKVASVPGPPPLCWWTPITEAPADDAVAVKKWWDEEIRPWLKGHAAAGNLQTPSLDSFHDAVKADKEGKGVMWYRLEVNEAALPGGNDQRVKALVDAGCSTSNSYSYGTTFPVLISLNFFPTGEPPAPVIDSKVLAQYAYDVMDLVAPKLNWNPKIASRDSAALINLPTWLWVNQGEAVQTRRVTASVGPVSVTVTANTDGVSVNSPAGTTQCSAAQASTVYQRGTSESSACTLVFNRSSKGYPDGFPVDTSTAWNATWTSTTGENGELNNRSQSATTYIPVVQSQALVTGIN